jgi:hypothetical protein
VGVRNAPPGYRPVPRPPINHRWQPIGIHQGNHLIAVDRGPAATTLTPPIGPAAPRTVAIGNQPAQLLPKTPNSNVSAFRPGAGSVNGRSPYGSPTYGLTGVQQQPGSVPTYHPTAPTTVYHAPVPNAPVRPITPAPAPQPHYNPPPPPPPHFSPPPSMPHGAPSGGRPH